MNNPFAKKATTAKLFAKVKEFAAAVEAVAFAPAPVAAPVPARKQAPTAEELSEGRQAVIVCYLEGRTAFPQMADPRFMYRVIAEEQAFQAARLADLKERVCFERGEAAEAMAREIDAISTNVARLGGLLRHVVQSQKAA